jgi:hypothetical protein
MDMNYFLKRLQAGEDMSDIGNEIADLMNEAQAAYEAEEKEKAAALAKALAEKKAKDEAAAKAKEEKKAALLKVLVDTIAEYGTLECPEYADMFVADEEDIQALADSMTSIFTIIKMFGAAPLDMKNAKPARPVVTVRSDDDILKDFVKNFRV